MDNEKRTLNVWRTGMATAIFAFLAAFIFYAPIGNYKVVFSFVFLTVLAGVLAVVMGGITFFSCKNMKRNLAKVVFGAIAFPFACVAWSFLVFEFQGIVNERLFHRDPGDGEYYQCILPNGYGISMCDRTDYGMIFNAKLHSTPKAGRTVFEDRVETDGAGEVCLLQVEGPYILGFSDESVIAAYKGQKRFFLLNTSTDAQEEYKTEKDLRQAAEKLDIRVHLEPIFSVFKRFRYTWFDTFTSVLMIAPVLLGFGYLVLWIYRKRREVS